jgi:hypothetical protein
MQKKARNTIFPVALLHSASKTKDARQSDAQRKMGLSPAASAIPNKRTAHTSSRHNIVLRAAIVYTLNGSKKGARLHCTYRKPAANRQKRLTDARPW